VDIFNGMKVKVSSRKTLKNDDDSHNNNNNNNNNTNFLKSNEPYSHINK